MKTQTIQTPSRFHIRRKLLVPTYNFMIIIMFIIISVLLLTMRKVGFEEPVSLKHHLIHQRQKEDCRENCSMSDTVNHEEADAKLLQGLDVFSFNWSLSRSDSKQRYRFLDFILPGNKFAELSKRYTVSIATQSSLEWLHHIVDLSQHWTGPVSLAVFVAGEEFLLTKLYIRYLRQCFPHVKEQISFHLAYSRDFPPTDDPNLAFNYKHDCSNPEAVLSDLLKYRSPGTTKWRNDVLYPQNHLRNQARRNCQTEYVYVIDVDIVPSIGMTDSLDAFLRKSQCEKLCAYVIPVYEIEENASFPRNKAEVLNMSKNKKARPFHQLVYSLAQSSTNYKMWESNVEDSTDVVHVNHNVTKCKPWYEPFYVARADVPEYDERFIGYGFTRNTQAYEMITAGYQFQVLSPIFSCHWGLRSYKKNYNPSRTKQVMKNSALLASFRAEVKARYTKVQITC